MSETTMSEERWPAASPADLAACAAHLGREMRAVAGVGHRCPCGDPDVLVTEPRLPGGTPFPTTFYATCPRLTGAISTLESQGVMKEMSDRLAADPDLAAAYAAAHDSYLAHRGRLGQVEEIDGISAGGMPNRVKCLHVLVAHSLAEGPGVNPLGDEALAMLEPWWEQHPCQELLTASGEAAAAADSTAADDSTVEGTSVEGAAEDTNTIDSKGNS